MSPSPKRGSPNSNGKIPRKRLSLQARLVGIWLVAVIGGVAAAQLAKKPFKVWIGNTPYETYIKNKAAFEQYCEKGYVYGYRPKNGAPLGFTCVKPTHPNAPKTHWQKIGNQLAQNVELCLTALFVLILAKIVNSVLGAITRGARTRGVLAESEMAVSTASLAVAVNTSQKSIVSELTRVIKNETKKVMTIQRVSQNLLEEWGGIIEAPAKTPENQMKRQLKLDDVNERRKEATRELGLALQDVEVVVRAQLSVIRALPPGERAALQDAVRTGLASVNTRMNALLENVNRRGVGAAAGAVMNSAQTVAVASVRKALTAAGNAATGGGVTAARKALRLLPAPRPSARNNTRARLNNVRRLIEAAKRGEGSSTTPNLNTLIRQERNLAAAVGSPTRYPSPPRRASPPRRRRSPSQSPNKTRNANKALNNILKQFN